MVWNIDLVKMLRYYINDIDLPQAFTDEKLKVFILIGLSQLQTSLYGIDVGGPYSIDLDLVTVTPDPCESISDKNTAFLNLIVLAAACILVRAELKQKAARYGFTVTDDKSSISSKDMISSMQTQSKEFCKSFDLALKEFKMTKGRGCKFILSPFSRGSIQWRGI